MTVPVSRARRRERHLPVRVVLLLGIATGLAVPLYFGLVAEETPLAWDFIAYYAAAEAYLAGEAFVGLEAPVGCGIYVYPPIAVLGFVPYALIGRWELAYLVHTLINVALLGALARLVIRELDRLAVPLGRSDRLVIHGFFLLSLYPIVAVGLGQLDPLVALSLAGVMAAIERDGEVLAGGSLAVATGVKVFPAAVGVVLLEFRRWRATLAGAFAGGLILVASLAVFGRAVHVEYLRFLTVERSRLGAFAEGVSPDFFAVTLARPLAALLPSFSPPLYGLVAVAVVAPVLVVVSRRRGSVRDRYVAFLATVLAVLVVAPSTNLNHLLYLYMPLTIVLYDLEPGRTRSILLLGLAVTLVPVQPAQLAVIVESIGVPTTAMGPGGVVHDALSVASVALVGSLLLLLGCLSHAMEGSEGSTSPLAQGLDEGA